MKRIITIVAVLMLLAACGPQVTPPAPPTPQPTATPQPIPDVQATVESALRTFEEFHLRDDPHQAVPTRVVIPMFDTGDAQVFFGDADVTDQFASVQAFYDDGTLTFWAEQPSDRLSNDVGTVMLVPNLIQDRFRFGGIGTKIVGVARFTNRGSDGAIGTAYWENDGPDGRDVVIVQFDGEVMHGVPGGDDHPFDFHNGIILHVTIQVP